MAALRQGRCHGRHPCVPPPSKPASLSAPAAPRWPPLLPLPQFPEQLQLLEQALSALFTQRLHGDFGDVKVEVRLCSALRWRGARLCWLGVAGGLAGWLLGWVGARWLGVAGRLECRLPG